MFLIIVVKPLSVKGAFYYRHTTEIICQVLENNNCTQFVFPINDRNGLLLAFIVRVKLLLWYN